MYDIFYLIKTILNNYLYRNERKLNSHKNEDRLNPTSISHEVILSVLSHKLYSNL